MDPEEQWVDYTPPELAPPPGALQAAEEDQWVDYVPPQAQAAADDQWVDYVPPQAAAAPPQADQWEDYAPPKPPTETTPGTKPAPESQFMTGVRSFLHGLPGAVGGVAAGAVAGGVGGAVGGFPGMLGGAILGGVAGGFAGEKGKEVALNLLGFDDSHQRAVNAKEHPWTAAGAEAATAVVGGTTGAVRQGARLISGGVGGGFEAGRQLVTGEELDPVKIAATTAAGAAFAKPYKWNSALEAKGAELGQKIRPPEPPSANSNPGSVASSGTAEPAIPPSKSTETEATIGNPESRAVGSEVDYNKPAETATGDNAGVTVQTADQPIDLSVAAALDAENIQTHAEQPPVPPRPDAQTPPPATEPTPPAAEPTPPVAEAAPPVARMAEPAPPVAEPAPPVAQAGDELGIPDFLRRGPGNELPAARPPEATAAPPTAAAPEPPATFRVAKDTDTGKHVLFRNDEPVGEYGNRSQAMKARNLEMVKQVGAARAAREMPAARTPDETVSAEPGFVELFLKDERGGGRLPGGKKKKPAAEPAAAAEPPAEMDFPVANRVLNNVPFRLQQAKARGITPEALKAEAKGVVEKGQTTPVVAPEKTAASTAAAAAVEAPTPSATRGEPSVLTPTGATPVPPVAGAAGGAGAPPGGVTPPPGGPAAPPPAPQGPSSAHQRILDRISPAAEKPWWQKVPKTKGEFRETMDNIYTAVKAELHPIVRMRDQGGMPLKGEDDFYVAARLTKGNMGRAEFKLKNSQYDIETKQNTGKAFKEILAPVKEDMDGFTVYATAKHALELNKRKVETGITDADANHVVATGAGKYDKVFRDLVAFQDQELTNLTKAGLISKDAAARMRAMNQAYVPYHRLMDEGAGTTTGPGSLGVKKPLHAIEGSKRPIIDPIDSIIRNTYAFTAIAENNLVRLKMRDWAMNHPNGNQFMERVHHTKPVTVSSPEVDAFLQTHGLDPMLTETLTVFRKDAFRPRPDEIRLFNNGKAEDYKVDPRVANALDGMDQETFGLLTRIAAVPARTLRAGAVLAPEFGIRNIIRDQFSAFIQSKHGYVPVYDAAMSVGSLFKHDKVYQDWVKGGGANSTLTAIDRKQPERRPEDLGRQGQERHHLAGRCVAGGFRSAGERHPAGRIPAGHRRLANRRKRLRWRHATSSTTAGSAPRPKPSTR